MHKIKQQILEVMHQIPYHAGFAPFDSRKVGVTILVFSSNSSHLTNMGASNNFQSAYLARHCFEAE